MTTILVIEDEDSIRENTVELLELEGFEALAAADGHEGVRLALERHPDLVICDVSMPGIDGYEVFEILSSKPRTAVIPFIFVSARASRADVRRGMALGADDYLTKPFTRAELLDSIRTRLQRRKVEPGSAQAGPDGAVPGAPADAALGNEVVALDPAVRALFADADRFARSNISVLILGETGVGKEVFAEHVHRTSGRPGPFVPINCAALAESLVESELFGHEKGSFTGALQAKAGLFESAERGTVFLDEVGELPAPTQVRLLRVLEERRVTRIGARVARAIDVRFVSATNRDLERAVNEGLFRQDLLFRLDGVTLTVPPLRDRSADVCPLAELFVRRSCSGMGRQEVPRVGPEAQAVLEGYAWPGNIRELRNVVERAVLLCEGAVVEPRHLPSRLTDPAVEPGRTGATDPRERLLIEMEALDRGRVIEALERCAGNQTQAAKLLGISRRTLVTRLGEYDLPRPRRKGS